ncbi:MAG: hypothetical protein SYC29_15325 [Planctomycetota bacterium]|nr:hypothetical protein [Planctomycetota bacterium]
MRDKRTGWNDRIRALTACALLAAALIFGLSMGASGQDTSSDRAPVQEYMVLEQNDLIFNTVDLARNFITQMGEQGWIFPDGTQLLAHTFEPGTAAAYTRILIRPAGPYDEENAFVILRRERK